MPKNTSFQYGREYQLAQAKKYYERNSNHWKTRIELTHRLFSEYAIRRTCGRDPERIRIVDVGCSIGTFAIEYAKLGLDSYGIDFDLDALEIAEQISKKEGVSPRFVCGDVADWISIGLPEIDIALCIDIFEHLHDDELGALLQGILRNMSRSGTLIFHTFPTKYDYIFFGSKLTRFPLYPLRGLRPRRFARITKIYAHLLDITKMILRHNTREESIKKASHCNPTTAEHLTDILERSGFKILILESANLYPYQSDIQKLFGLQPISHRNLFGVAVPR